MSSAEETIITMVALFENAYSADDLHQVRLDTIKRWSPCTRPASIDYIARDKLKRLFHFDLGIGGELRRGTCQLVRDLQNIAGFFLSFQRGNTSWLYYTLTA